MPEKVRRILLDQNVPQALSEWLKEKLLGWEIQHVNELGFQGKTDEFLYLWAQKNVAIIVTYDEDFADSRFYPLGHHHGIVRLRVWPTTIEQTQKAMERLLTDLSPSNWRDCLSLMVVKHPYYGFGMEVVPKARFDDRKLHLVCTNSGLCGAVISGITAFFAGNRAGQYYAGLQIGVSLDRALSMQYNGNEGWKSERFNF